MQRPPATRELRDSPGGQVENLQRCLTGGGANIIHGRRRYDRNKRNFRFVRRESSWTAAAVVLAADALSGSSGAAGLFRGEGLPAGLDLAEPHCTGVDAHGCTAIATRLHS